MRWTALVAAALLVAGCDNEVEPAPAPKPIAVKKPVASPVKEEQEAEQAPSLEDSAAKNGGDGKLYVYFLDVGEGDATLIISPVGKTVLIDAGPPEASSHLDSRLSELVSEPIDLVVLTHPHRDHYGGIAEVLRTVGIKRFLDSRVQTDDPGYAALMSALKANSVPVFVPAPDAKTPGEPLRISLGGEAALSVFWPRAPVESFLEAGARSPEANGIVARVEFRETSVLLEADAQAETEALLLNRRLPFESTLLKVSSHGVEGPSTEPFLVAVKPLGAIVSVGAGNQQEAPSRTVLARLEKAGAKVFRTDLDGEIEAVSDGKVFSLSVEKPAAGVEAGTEEVFQRNAPATTRVSLTPKTKKGASKLKGHEDGKFKKVVKVSADALIPDAVKQKYAGGKAQSGKVLYVASRNAKVFHMPDCIWAKKIKKENLVTFTSRTDAAKERRPAGDCNP